jgi:N-acetylneuraminic acid mutarotase
MGTARSYFYTGALSSGKVLVAGGGNQSTRALATAEVYDPANGTFTATGGMSTPRVPALPNSMVALLDGRMLVAGGDDENCTALSSAEVYDPSAGTWSLTGNMTYSRDNAMAVALANGQVLVSGGYSASAVGCTGVTAAAQASAELYDPSSGKFAMTGSPLTPRAAGAVVLLSNGSALLVDGEETGDSPFNGTAEVYDPTSDGGTFSAAGMPPGPAGYAFAYPLPDGQVLVKTLNAGGVVSLYDPSSNMFTAQPSDPAAAGITCGVALTSGDVFVAAGAQAEVYQASTGSWQMLGATVVSRSVCGAAELPDGNVLVVGGTDTTGASVTSAEVCNPHPAANDGG